MQLLVCRSLITSRHSRGKLCSLMSSNLYYLIGAAQAKKTHQNVTGLATGRGFFLILWCNHTGNHPLEELAKFGSRSKRKVENFKNPAIFWLKQKFPYTGQFQKLFPGNLGTLAHFFHKNPLHELHLHFSFVSKSWKFTPKNTDKNL
jgi:hypothetical protein